MKDADHHHLGPLKYGTIRYILILESYTCPLIGFNSKADDVRFFYVKETLDFSQNLS